MSDHSPPSMDIAALVILYFVVLGLIIAYRMGWWADKGGLVHDVEGGDDETE